MTKINFTTVGLVDAEAKRTSRTSRDSLEFATAMYAYNRGIFDTQITTMLSNCNPTADPAMCELTPSHLIVV